MLSEINYIEKDKYYMIFLICVRLAILYIKQGNLMFTKVADFYT